MDESSDSGSEIADSSTSASSSDSELDSATKDIPFAELLAQRRSSVGPARKHDNTAADQDPQSSRATSKSKGGVKSRENKNRPVEVSSRRPVPRLRQVVESSTRKNEDPRFSDAAGKFKDEVFKKRYAFIYDETLPQEKARAMKALKGTKSSARKQELRGDVTRIQQQLSAAKSEKQKREAELASKAKEREAVKRGKKPFFLKRSEKRRQELISRYTDLKASGRLEKVMAKKRKKNAAKDHRYVPSERRS